MDVFNLVRLRAGARGLYHRLYIHIICVCKYQTGSARFCCRDIILYVIGPLENTAPQLGDWQENAVKMILRYVVTSPEVSYCSLRFVEIL